MAKKTVKATEEVEAVAVVSEVVEVVTESETKKNFRAHIAAYAKANPTKYELKREELERQLNNMK